MCCCAVAVVPSLNLLNTPCDLESNSDPYNIKAMKKEKHYYISINVASSLPLNLFFQRAF